MHCFISARAGNNSSAARWAWHIADAEGHERRHSDAEFTTFGDCVDDARAHGYCHVEVPVLDWSSTARTELVINEPPAPNA